MVSWVLTLLATVLMVAVFGLGRIAETVVSVAGVIGVLAVVLITLSLVAGLVVHK